MHEETIQSRWIGNTLYNFITFQDKDFVFNNSCQQKKLI